MAHFAKQTKLLVSASHRSPIVMQAKNVFTDGDMLVTVNGWPKFAPTLTRKEGNRSRNGSTNSIYAPPPKLRRAVTRIELANSSNVKGVGAGVFEYKIDFGPGCRIYFGKMATSWSSS
jgi:hypothetical protein